MEMYKRNSTKAIKEIMYPRTKEMIMYMIINQIQTTQAEGVTGNQVDLLKKMN